MESFEEDLAKVLKDHPLAASVNAAAASAQMQAKTMLMEWGRDRFDEAGRLSQVAQAVDRSLILAGLTTERFAGIDFAARATTQTKAVGIALKAKTGARRAGIADGLQIARIGAAMTETLMLNARRMPGLADPGRNQEASGILFSEILAVIERTRPDVPSMTDGEVLDLSIACFEAKSAKIARAARP